MTNEHARFLLGAYRANGADARDPVFKKTLNQARRDPVLATWFRQQRDFDEIISSKVRTIEPPAGLRGALAAGLQTMPDRRHLLRRWLAIAAALALGLTVAGHVKLNRCQGAHNFVCLSLATTPSKPIAR